jgi:transcriptional regulator GlxA family with amidase domain
VRWEPGGLEVVDDADVVAVDEDPALVGARDDLAQALDGLHIGVGVVEGVDRPALRDPHVAAAVQLVHGQPQRPWTVGGLAAEVALSRSAFAARFRELVGEPPMRYLVRARLVHAAGLLHTTDLGLGEIARRTGHESESSFSRAFKRVFGIAPGAYRGRAEVPLAPPAAGQG